MTAKLKGWLVDSGRANQESSDAEVKSAAAQAIVDGDLTAEKLGELQTEEVTESPVDKLTSAIEKAIGPVADAVKANADALAEMRSATVEEVADEILDKATTTADAVAEAMSDEAPGREVHKSNPDLTKSLAGNGAANVRVKGAHEQYSDTKSAARYSEHHKNSFLRSRPAQLAGRNMDHSSELDKAIVGAWFKFCANASSRGQLPRGLKMTEHDKQLVQYAMHEKAWTGIINGSGSEDHGAIKVDNRKLSDFEVKALIDDSTSGGLEAAPIAFDDAVILTPLLHGELFPLVNVINISRGRRIEGASIGNPTFAAGTEGTALTVFDTSSFVSAFDTTVFEAVGGMEIGLDLEEDSPVNLGALVAQAYGEQALKWLDDQIANGDGTTEPQGVLNASGIGTVASANGTTGPPKVDDYEGLLFGVAKQFRNPADRERSVFCGTETSYQRARSIAVGSSDVRRVFGHDHEDYRLLGHPYKISEQQGNTKVWFANLRHYRMYRRLGLNIRVETGGKELATKNLSLIVVRMRYGGKMEQGGAASVSTDMQT
tara:strand:- start:11430 stop:13064 length:1635 start_codon:yes stop_codon:yes gene_type:complete